MELKTLVFCSEPPKLDNVLSIIDPGKGSYNAKAKQFLIQSLTLLALHHSHVFLIAGPSYRMKGKLEQSVDHSTEPEYNHA